jgi:hypothetical protein
MKDDIFDMFRVKKLLHHQYKKNHNNLSTRKHYYARQITLPGENH